MRQSWWQSLQRSVPPVPEDQFVRPTFPRQYMPWEPGQAEWFRPQLLSKRQGCVGLAMHRIPPQPGTGRFSGAKECAPKEAVIAVACT